MCPTNCNNGCIHRVMVHTIATAVDGLVAAAGGAPSVLPLSLLFTMDNTEQLIRTLRPLLVAICDSKGPGRYGVSCNHGAGHGQ